MTSSVGLSAATEISLRDGLRRDSKTLNLDIWIHVISFIPFDKDLLSLANTSHALHFLAMRELLRDGVWFKRAYRLPSFLEFLEARGGLHVPFVETVSFTVLMSDLEDENQVDNAVEIFRRCKNIKVLHFWANETLGYYEPIESAITQLENIKELYVENVDEELDLRAFFDAFRSRCTKVSLCYRTLERDDDSPGYENSLLTLQVFSTSLQELELTQLDGMNVPLRGSEIQYPHLITLSIQLTDTKSWGLETLVHAFPNLRRLSLPYIDTRDEQNLEQLRIENKRQYAKHQWPRLDSVLAPVDSLYVLGLNCPIHRWRIRSLDVDTISEGNIRKLTACLREFRVSQMDITLSLGVWGSFTGIKHFFEEFPAASLPELTHIRCHVTLNYIDASVTEEIKQEIKLVMVITLIPSESHITIDDAI